MRQQLVLTTSMPGYVLAHSCKSSVDGVFELLAVQRVPGYRVTLGDTGTSVLCSFIAFSRK